MDISKKSAKVKILVCYHKKSPIIANEILSPILVGASKTSKEVQEYLETECQKQGVALLRDDFTLDSSVNDRGGGLL